MRQRIVSSILCALMLTAVMIVSVPETGMSQPTTIYVDDDRVSPCNNTTYHTIEAGVNAANGGDTVYVCQGTYRENFTIDKTITLTGEGKHSTIVELYNVSRIWIVRVMADYVNISGFTFRGHFESTNVYLLYTLNADHVNVSGNVFTSNTTQKSAQGLKMEYSDSALIKNNYFLPLYQSDVVGHRQMGLHLTDSDNATIEGNTFDGAFGQYAVFAISSDNTTLEGNIFVNLTWHGIMLALSRDNIVRNNSLESTDGHCLVTYLSSHDHIGENEFQTSYYGGCVWISSSNRAHIWNNTISGSGYGFRLSNSNNNTLENNDVAFLNRGVDLEDSDGNVMKYNRVSSASDIGIYLKRSDSTYMFLNNISGNGGVGVKLAHSNDTVMENCTIKSNGAEGVYSHNSTKMMVINSTVSQSGTYDFKSVVDSNGTTLNVTFSTVSVDNTSVLVVKNFLHIKTYDTDQSSPLQNVDVVVTDNGDPVYATSGYGGSNSKTQSDGTVRWIIVTDRWYYHSSTATENITWVEVGAGEKCFYDCSREVDMSTSHWELFYRYIPLWINGTVFNDVDRDGIWDGWNAEPGIPWVSVELHKSIVPPLATVMWTDYGGNYSFGGCFVEPNVNYTVVEINLPGWRSSTPDIVPLTLPTSNQIVNFGDYSNDSPSAPSYAVSIGINSTENETVRVNETLTLNFRIENSGDAASQARFLRFAAVFEDLSILDVEWPYTGQYKVYSHHDRLLWSGIVQGTLTAEPYAPFDNSGSTAYMMLIWSLWEHIYLEGGGYVLFSFDVVGKNTGDTDVVFFLYSTEDHKSTHGGAYLTSISDKANIFMDNSTGLWYPVHNSYDPWVTVIPPMETAHGHRWDQWSWTPAYTLSSFAKASINVTVTS